MRIIAKKRSHHNSNTSLHYLVKGECQESSDYMKQNVLFNNEF